MRSLMLKKIFALILMFITVQLHAHCGACHADDAKKIKKNATSSCCMKKKNQKKSNKAACDTKGITQNDSPNLKPLHIPENLNADDKKVKAVVNAYQKKLKRIHKRAQKTRSRYQERLNKLTNAN